MAKLSPKFLKYFFIALLTIAILFPLAHSSYEGMSDKKEKSDSEDQEEETEEEGEEYEEDKEGAVVL